MNKLKSVCLETLNYLEDVIACNMSDDKENPYEDCEEEYLLAQKLREALANV